MCGCVFFRPHVHILLFSHSHYLAFLIYIYINARAHTLALTLSSLSITLMPIWEILIFCQNYGNGSMVTQKLLASGFFMTYFRCVRNAFVADVILLVGRRGPCFINVISFHPIFLRIDLFRWLWLILLDPRYVLQARKN